MDISCHHRAMEAENRVWGCIQAGLPVGQLSFLVRAGSDTLPTPLNLKRWKMRVDSRCPLCNHHHPTVQHILSTCPTALQQGRYTWRPDSALKVLVDGIQSGLPDARVLADLPGLRAGLPLRHREATMASCMGSCWMSSWPPAWVLAGRFQRLLSQCLQWLLQWKLICLCGH